jgi:oligosaccharide repeat unit polymerase
VSGLFAITAAERWSAAGVGVALIVLALVRGTRARRRGEQPVEPLTVFLLGWGVELALFALPFVAYSDSSVRTYVAVYGSIVTFSAGCLAVYRYVRPRAPRDEDERLLPGRIRLAWGFCLVLGLVGFAMYVRAVDAVLGWRMLFDEPHLVRAIQTTSTEFDQVYGRWRLLTYFAQIGFLLWTIGLRAGAFRGRWRLAIPLGALSILPMLFTGERTLLATMLVWAVLFHLIWRPVRDWRRLTAGLAITALVLGTAFSLLGGRVGKTIDNHPEISSVLETDLIRARALEYVYITANIPALDKLMEDPVAPRTDGAMTLLPGVKIVNALGIGDEPPEEVGAFYPIPFSTFNNYSWLGSFYLDFGLLGCLLLPALVGALAALVARRVAQPPTLLGSWTLSLALYVIAFTPLLNKLSTTLTWQYLLLGPFVAMFVREGGFREASRLARSRRVLRIGAAVVAAASAVLLALGALATSNEPAAADGDELAQRLEAAADRIDVIYADDPRIHPPDAIASRLHIADPGMRYQGVADYRDVPDTASAIGLQIHGTHDAWMWGKSANGEQRGMHVILRGPWKGHYPLDGASPNLLINGDLEPPVQAPWQEAESRVARLESDRAASWASDASLRVRGTGRRAPSPSFFTQVVRDLPDHTQGAIYTFRIAALARGLSRPLPAAMKFTYRDGTSDFFPATAGTAGSLGGDDLPPIPAGTTELWQPGTAIGRAERPLRSIQVFLVDTGTRPLRGRAWIDGVTLVEGAGLASFPDPY